MGRRLEKFWWLASFPKSGNTWLRMFLLSYTTDRHITINNVNRFSLSDINPYFYNSISPVPLEDLEWEQAMQLRGAVLLHSAAFNNNPNAPQFMKTHCLNSEELIPPSLTYGAIYIVRDPRDVAISYARHNGMSIDQAIDTMGINVALGKDNIYQISGSWSENVETWIRQDSRFQTYIIKYEDMLKTPESVFKGVMNFLRLEYVEEPFNKALGETTFDKLKGQEEKYGFVEKVHQDKFFKYGTSGHWKDILSPEQADRIVNDHGKVMEKLGYTTHEQQNNRHGNSNGLRMGGIPSGSYCRDTHAGVLSRS